VGLKRGTLSFVSTTEELLGRNSNGSSLKTENTAVGIRRADQATPSISNTLTLSSSTSGGLSVGIVRSRTKAKELVVCLFFLRNQKVSGLCSSSRILNTRKHDVSETGFVSVLG
jgi:hypothetical protein